MNATRTIPAETAHPEQRAGLFYGLGAYGLWGLLPLYFKLLPGVSPVELVAHRVVWSVALMALLLAALRLYPAFLEALRQPRILGGLTVSALLVAGNWLAYVWAVAADHVVAASLGYFLNPLVNVLLGFLFLKERLRRGQLVAISIAGLGVAILAAGELDTLWISLTLAISFGFYALIRKLTPVAAPVGLSVETLVLAPPALLVLGWMAQDGALAFGQVPTESALLIGLGAVTSIPLLLFAGAARRLPMSTLGIMQYIAPSLQFLTGVFLFGERLSPERWASFGLIWLALLLFVWDSIRGVRGR